MTPTPSEPVIDDLGYVSDAEVVVTPPVNEVPPKTDEVIKHATGYGKEEAEVIPPPAEVVPPVEKKPEEMTDEEKAQKEISDTVKDLGEGYDKEKIKKFAIDNKLNKDQLAAYVKMTKDEDAAFLKSQQDAKTSQRKSWREELAKDPEFGGENYDKNVDLVEKLLEKNMTNTKKVLTDKGGVLPPYIMRDLLAIAKALNPKTNLVQGEAPAPVEDEKNFLDDLYT